MYLFVDAHFKTAGLRVARPLLLEALGLRSEVPLDLTSQDSNNDSSFWLI